jgi:uncharacterized glyoxalase superfamily protein PhnB
MAHPIPSGHHAITPHLIIKGAAEAIEFYKRAFGATEHSRMPFPGPDGQVKLGHAELQIGDSRLFLADKFPQQGGFGLWVNMARRTSWGRISVMFILMKTSGAGEEWIADLVSHGTTSELLAHPKERPLLIKVRLPRL